ncbi:hypothetical protein NC651_013805 [Populus alba x Populus x berolinensis]|nr:hypothetical protein NC651_013805 [Populus alba x Populus x berolinensis]
MNSMKLWAKMRNIRPCQNKSLSTCSCLDLALWVVAHTDISSITILVSDDVQFRASNPAEMDNSMVSSTYIMP